jgi:mRNA-degrading endonuclease RelE of RelBE toxin-antitoxin system
MKLNYTPHFVRNYSKAPADIQRAFQKQALLLVENPRHPSLRTKKYDESAGLWQARVTRGWRFYFTIEGDTCRMLEIKAHPK